MHTISPPLSTREKQIIIGTILGGSSVIKTTKGKHCYLAMRGIHGKWLEHKAFQLSKFASDKPFSIEKTNRWRSLCYPIFDTFRDSFYNNGQRKLQLEVLEGLHDIAIAIWFGDSGRYEKEKATINTHVWGEAGSNIFVEYFNLIDYSAKVIQERKKFRVQLDKKSSRKLIELTSPHLPLFMMEGIDNVCNTSING